MVVLPGAEAQWTKVAAKVTFDDRNSDFSNANGGRIVPGSPGVRLAVKTYVEIPQFEYCLSPLTVHYAVSAPAYAAIVINPATDAKVIPYSLGEAAPVPVNPLQTSQLVFDSALSITTRPENPPALVNGHYDVKADVFPSSGFPQCTLLGDTGMGTIQLQNDYVAGLQVDFASRRGPDVLLGLTNLANGPSRFSFEFGRPGDDWIPSTQTLTLEARQTRGPNAEISGVVQLPRSEIPPAWTGRIRVTGESATPITTGTPSKAQALAVVDGAHDEPVEAAAADWDSDPAYLPGFESAALLATWAGIGLRRRRR